MLEFCKEILLKVSFDKLLFTKELHKAVKWCQKDENLSLKSWCLAMFGSQYEEEIIEAFIAIG